MNDIMKDIDMWKHLLTKLNQKYEIIPLKMEFRKSVRCLLTDYDMTQWAFDFIFNDGTGTTDRVRFSRIPLENLERPSVREKIKELKLLINELESLEEESE